MSESRRKGAGRKWLWIVPVGCLGSLGVVVGIALFVLWLVFGLLKSSEPYRLAMTMAQADARVAAALGEPVEPSRFLTGNIEVSGDTGHAELTIPLSGPKGRGSLHVVANMSGGRWVVEEAVLTVGQSGERIDFLDQSGESQ